MDDAMRQARERIERFSRQDFTFDEISGVGEAANGLVTVRVKPGGKPSELTIDPRAMRLGSEVLGEEIVKAISAAIDDAAATLTDMVGAGMEVDPLQLAKRHDSTGIVSRAMEDFQRNSKDLQSTLDHLSRHLR
jgi:DNA-binding protein YbaB